MKTIALSEVIIPRNRQRKLFSAEKMAEFVDGIAKRGLLHPIILRKDKDPKSPLCGHLILVAGERRMRAATELADLDQEIRHDGTTVPLGHIPYTLFEDLDPLAAEEAELDENLHRENLTWQEQAAAVARLASLRQRQAASLGNPAPAVADIALEVRGRSDGSYHEDTRRELILADHLHKPEVRAAKTADEAWKALKRLEGAERSRILGESVGRTFTSEQHRCYNADSLEWLATYRDASFDCILTDPPYGMGADEFGDSGGIAAGAHGYKDDEESFFALLKVCADNFSRITKPQAHLYWFCDIGKFQSIKQTLEFIGWQVFRTPLIWFKPSGARAPWPDQGPQRKYETILYAVKGKRNVLRMAGDVIECGPDSNLGHSAQKPVALFRDLLSRSCRPGDTVLDPFCGTGPVFAAAHELKVAATGVEIDAASYGIAVKRISELKSQLELTL